MNGLIVLLLYNTILFVLFWLPSSLLIWSLKYSVLLHLSHIASPGEVNFFLSWFSDMKHKHL